MVLNGEVISPSQIFFLDLGSGFTKFGSSTDENTPFIIPTAFGIPRIASNINQSAEETLYGERLCRFKGALERRELFPNSHPNNNFDIFKFVQFLFENQTHTTEGSGLILGISPEWSQDFLYQIQAFLFPKFNFASILPIRTDMLALIGHKLKTGIVLNIGHYFSRIVQYFDGKLITTTGLKTSVAGRTIRDYLIRLYKKKHPYLSGSIFAPTLTNIVNSKCKISLNINKTLSSRGTESNEKEKIPIPQFEEILELDMERYLAPEVLFHPKLINHKDLSIDDLLVQSLKECHPTYRSKIFANIVLSGGGCAFPNFSQRISQNYSRIPLLSQSNLKIHPQPEFSSWKGMQLIASSSFYSKHAKSQNQFFAKL